SLFPEKVSAFPGETSEFWFDGCGGSVIMSSCSDTSAGAVSLIRYARKPGLNHLDDLLHERAHRPLRIRDSPLRHHLPVSETPEAVHDSGGPFQAIAEGDDAAADL